MSFADVQVGDYDAVGEPEPADIAVFASTLSVVLTQELDGACTALGVTVEELLLTTLARTFARTSGKGTATVDAAAHGHVRCALTLTCVGPSEIPANEMLEHTRNLLGAASLREMVHGGTAVTPIPETLLSYGVDDPAWGGHLLELHVARVGSVFTLDWHYDTRTSRPTPFRSWPSSSPSL